MKAKYKYLEIKDFLRQELLDPPLGGKLPTVRELMKRFGVSQAPVSRALKELEYEKLLKGRCGAGTRSTVLNGVAERVESTNNDRPKLLYFYTDFFAESLWRLKHAVCSAARQRETALLLYALNQQSDLPTLIRQAVTSAGTLQGILLTPSMKLTPALLSYLDSLEIPVIFLDDQNDYTGYRNLSTFASDMIAAGESCVRVLFKQGHRRIGYIRNEPETFGTIRMQEGCERAVRETHEITFLQFPGVVRAWEDSLAAAAKLTRFHANAFRRERLTALIYTSGVGAFAGAGELQRQGFAVPDEISIIGVQQNTQFRYAYLQINNIDYNYREMVYDAFAVLFGELPAQTARFYPVFERCGNSIRKLTKPLQ